MQTRHILPGDVIHFTPTHETEETWAIVVKTSIWPHCLGASTITAYRPANHGLYGFTLAMGYTVHDQPEEGRRQNNLIEARADYAHHLKQYPVWKERIERGEGVGW